MAQTTLPVLSSSGFPELLNLLLGTEIKCVERVLARAELSSCDWDDGKFSCCEKATVHHLGTEQEYCLGHFEEVSR